MATFLEIFFEKNGQNVLSNVFCRRNLNGPLGNTVAFTEMTHLCPLT